MVIRNAEEDQNRDLEGNQIFPQGVVGGQPAEEGAPVPDAENSGPTRPVQRDLTASKEYDAWDDDGNEGHPSYDAGTAPAEDPNARGDETKLRNEDVDPEKRQLEEWIQRSAGAGQPNLDE